MKYIPIYDKDSEVMKDFKKRLAAKYGKKIVFRKLVAPSKELKNAQ